MGYNFPHPGDRKPRRWGPLLFAVIVGAVGLKYLPPQALLPVVKEWRQKLFPTSQETPTPATPRPHPTLGPTNPVPRVTSPAVTPEPSSTPAPSRPNSTLPPATELTPSNLPLRLPGPAQVFVKRDQRIQQLEAKVAKYPVFALYRELAQHHLDLGNFQAAAQVFRTQASLYKRKGLRDAASILESRAAQTETRVRVFSIGNGPGVTSQATYTGAPLEPRQGCYLGAFIDRDDALKIDFTGDNWQRHHLPREFEARVGRRHASVFTYVKWGNFPRQWLLMCKQEGVIPQIAWEPDNLNAVKDDAYLQSCAKFLRELDWPVFVRFAGEMNGDWTPWHGNPALYKDKFRLVHRVLHRYAAKVATIWCVNAIPADNIDAYYPGDTACDWVGVNLYSTPFADNDRSRANFRESPLTLLEPVYRKYSARKPIAICEYGASHQSAVDGVLRTPFAVEKMSLLYGALPLLYPRVKLIDWYSSNNLVHAREGRKLNNYRLTQQPLIQSTYRQLTASPHFLTSYQEQANRPLLPAPRELASGAGLRRGQRLWLWVTSNSARPAVYILAGPKVLYAGQRFGKHVLDLDGIPTNVRNLTMLVYDKQSRCQFRRDLKIF